MSERTWDFDLDDLSPADFIAGHLAGEYIADTKSLEKALIAALTATFMRMGLGEEAAFDKAWEHAERGVDISLTEGSLRFDFDSNDKGGAG